MSKNVHFSDEPFLVRQISDQSEARKQNSQTPIEKRLASNSFYMEEKQKINTDKATKEKYEKKRKYINTPINERVLEADLKGKEADANIRKADMLEEHRYDYWWLGGKKSTRKTSRKTSRKTTRKTSRKGRKTKRKGRK
jgi:hypothetical protein